MLSLFTYGEARVYMGQLKMYTPPLATAFTNRIPLSRRQPCKKFTSNFILNDALLKHMTKGIIADFKLNFHCF